MTPLHTYGASTTDDRLPPTSTQRSYASLDTKCYFYIWCHHKRNKHMRLIAGYAKYRIPKRKRQQPLIMHFLLPLKMKNTSTKYRRTYFFRCLQMWHIVLSRSKPFVTAFFAFLLGGKNMKEKKGKWFQKQHDDYEGDKTKKAWIRKSQLLEE